jgi:hypothetical protein
MAQTAEEKAAAKAAKDAEKATAKAAKESATEVTVKFRDHKGEPTERTFSQEVHGDDFAKVADEFKASNASRIIA